MMSRWICFACLLMMSVSMVMIGCGEAPEVDQSETTAQGSTETEQPPVIDAGPVVTTQPSDDMVTIVIDGVEIRATREDAERLKRSQAEIERSLQLLDQENESLKDTAELLKQREKSISAAEETLEEIKRENEKVREIIDYEKLMVAEHEKALAEELERQNVIVGAVWSVGENEVVVKLDTPIELTQGMNLVIAREDQILATVEVDEIQEAIMRCKIGNRLQAIKVGDHVVRLKLKR